METHQGLVQPVTSDFPVEMTVVIETPDGRYSVGGRGAFVEDFEATETELLPDE